MKYILVIQMNFIVSFSRLDMGEESWTPSYSELTTGGVPPIQKVCKFDNYNKV